MYKGKIVDSIIERGHVKVKVEFSDGTDTFHETFETNQVQKPDWIDQQIKRRLEHLNGLPTLLETIEVGKEIAHDPVIAADAAPTERELYAANLKQFERYISAVVRGFTDEESEDYIRLKAWLKENFKPEYLDLFNG